MRVGLTVALILMAGCAGSEESPTSNTPEAGHVAPPTQAWNATMDPMYEDLALWALTSPFGEMTLLTEDGSLWCEWTLTNGTVNQCLVDGVVLVSEASATGRSVMMDGAPDGEFVFSHVVLDADMTEAFRFDQTFPAPSIGDLAFEGMWACATTWAGQSTAEETWGRWSVDAVGGTIDATWIAPGFSGNSVGGGGITSEMTSVGGGMRLVTHAGPLTITPIDMALQAAPEIETQVSHAPTTYGECENVVHEDTVPWPLTFTWTPWHGEPIDLSQDVPFEVWQEAA